MFLFAYYSIPPPFFFNGMSALGPTKNLILFFMQRQYSETAELI